MQTEWAGGPLMELGSKAFAERVKLLTDGRIEIQVFPAGTLAKGLESRTAVANGVAEACLVQRGHLYGYDNGYILDSARRYPGRLHPVVILDPQDPATPGRYREMVKNDHVRGFLVVRPVKRERRPERLHAELVVVLERYDDGDYEREKEKEADDEQQEVLPPVILQALPE